MVHPFLPRLLTSFAATAVVLGAAVFGVLWASGELEAVRSSGEGDVLWGAALNQDHAAYKLARARALKPDLLYLGSSRMTQFRAEMLPGVRAYVAGRAAPGAPAARAFLDRLYVDHRPRLVLLGVDPWWLHPAGVGAAGDFALSLSVSVANLFSHGLNGGLVNAMRWQGGLDPLGGRVPLGAMARAEASGFRPDGSYQYGDVLLDLRPEYHRLGTGHAEGFRYFIEQVRNGSGRFSVAERPSPVALAELAATLDAARAHGVEMALVLPPFPHAVMAAVRAEPRQAAWFAAWTGALAALAAEKGVPVIDMLDLADLGVGDEQTIDGIHVDERASARMLAELVRRLPALARLAGTGAAERLDALARAPAEDAHRLFR